MPERRVASKHIVCHDSHRPKVRLLLERLVIELFRRHIQWRAKLCRSYSMFLIQHIILVDREAEIDQSCEGKFSGDKALLEDDVLRLEISVTDLALVHVIQ